MKIKIITTNPEKCGIGDYTQRLVDGLRKYCDEDIQLVYTRQDSLNPLFFVKLLKNSIFNSDIIHIQFDCSFFGRNGIFIPFFYPVLWIIQRYKFKNKSNIITSFHEIRDSKNRILSLYYRLLNRIVVSCSDIIIIFSDETKNTLINQGILEKKIKLLSHGILTIPTFYNKQLAKKKLGFTDSDSIITIMGYIHYNKGHDILIESMKNGDAKLLIAGDARTEDHKTYLESLKNYVRNGGLDKKVRFLGFVKEEDIPLVLSATDVIALPYREIMQSGILNFIMAYQIPTITSNLSYFKNIEKEYGCILASEDITKDLSNLLGDNDLQEKLKEGTKTYAKLNSYKNTSLQMHMIYLEVGEADHPSVIYKDKSQKNRIEFLIKNTDGNVLEVGCATGYILSKVCKSGTGVDIREDRLIYAKIKYPHLNFTLASGEDMPFKNNSFDTVLLPDILEHVEYNIAKEIVKESLRVGKKVIITVPNSTSKWINNPEHKWIPTIKNINNLLIDPYNYDIKETNDFIYAVVK